MRAASAPPREPSPVRDTALPVDRPIASAPAGRPVAIAHLSDPHLSRQFYREHIKSLKVLVRAILDAGFDHLVITGDIVSTGDPDDFHLAREIFANHGLLRSDRLTVVPGNHDIFGGPHRAIDVAHFPRHLRTVDYARKLMLFEEAFAETFDGVHRLRDDSLYPFVKHVGAHAIIGLDSNTPWSLSRNPFGSNGHMDAGQLSALRSVALSELIRGRITWAAMHHHLIDRPDKHSPRSLWESIEVRTMRMHGRKRLLRSLSSLGVHGVLHGHVHYNHISQWNGMHLINGAGAVCDDPVPFLKYNVIADSADRVTACTRVLPIRYYAPAAARSIHRFQSIHLEPQLAGMP
jgi:3',5'-cyclic-AMP phosphodiesterase